MIRIRRRWLSLLRLWVLAPIALGLVLQPMVTAVGEVHELVHDPSGAHTFNPHAPVGDTDVAAVGEPDGNWTQTLHLMLHFAHCSGASATALPALSFLPALPPAGWLPVAKTPDPPQAPRVSLFKPPIFV